MTQVQGEDRMPPEHMLLLSVEDNMGQETHRLLKEGSQELSGEPGEVVTVKGDTFSEDFRQTEELLMVFPAEPFNGLTGYFVLGLMPAESGTFSLRQPIIERRGGDFVWTAEMTMDVAATRRWAYTRRPELRRVYLPLFDDPYESFEATIFHQTPLREPGSPHLPSSNGDWHKVEIPLTTSLIDQSISIDQCARLLEEMDGRFNIGGGEFLFWQEAKVTPAAIDRIAAELETGGLLKDGEKFNLTLDVRGQESTRNKRVRPLARYPITLFESEGRPIPATLGCSISS